MQQLPSSTGFLILHSHVWFGITMEMRDSWCLSSLRTNNKPHGTVAGLGLKLCFLILVLSWLAKYIVSKKIFFAHVKMNAQMCIFLACHLQNVFTVLLTFWTFSSFPSREKTEIVLWRNHTRLQLLSYGPVVYCGAIWECSIKLTSIYLYTLRQIESIILPSL